MSKLPNPVNFVRIRRDPDPSAWVNTWLFHREDGCWSLALLWWDLCRPGQINRFIKLIIIVFYIIDSAKNICRLTSINSNLPKIYPIETISSSQPENCSILSDCLGFVQSHEIEMGQGVARLVTSKIRVAYHAYYSMILPRGTPSRGGLTPRSLTQRCQWHCRVKNVFYTFVKGLSLTKKTQLHHMLDTVFSIIRTHLDQRFMG